jgi:hypothetical protein
LSFSGLGRQGIFPLTGSGCEKYRLGAVFPTSTAFSLLNYEKHKIISVPFFSQWAILGLKIICPECITLTDITGLEALPEPAYALPGASVGKRIRCDVSPAPLLQAVVTDGAGGA